MKRMRLRREIIAVLAMKLVLLTCLYVAFFGPSHRVTATPASVSDRLLGSDHR
jgi:hypothetical protein